MKKPFFVLLILVCSCSKKESVTIEKSAKVLTAKDTTEYPFSGNDSLLLDVAKNGVADKAIVHFYKTVTVNDSTEIKIYNLDFYNKGKRVYRHQAEMLSSYEFWSVDTGYDDYSGNNMQFISFSNSGRYCGSGNTEFMFSLSGETGIHFIDKWFGVPDAEFSEGTFAYPPNEKAKFKGFAKTECRVVDTIIANDTLSMAVFTDSVQYIFSARKWNKKQITPKGKIYRTEKIKEQFD